MLLLLPLAFEEVEVADEVVQEAGVVLFAEPEGAAPPAMTTLGPPA